MPPAPPRPWSVGRLFGTVDVPAWVLFLIVFYWTPPHFWALALRYRDDYAAAGVPMLPVIAGVEATTRRMLLYTGLMVGVSLLLVPLGAMSWIYLVAALGLGAWFLWDTWRVVRRPEDAMRLLRHRRSICQRCSLRCFWTSFFEATAATGCDGADRRLLIRPRIDATVISTFNTVGPGPQRVLVEIVDADGRPVLLDSSPTATLRDENGSPIMSAQGDEVWLVPDEEVAYAFLMDIPKPETYQLTVETGDTELPPAGFIAIADPQQIEPGETAPPSGETHWVAQRLSSSRPRTGARRTRASRCSIR